MRCSLKLNMVGLLSSVILVWFFFAICLLQAACREVKEDFPSLPETTKSPPPPMPVVTQQTGFVTLEQRDVRFGVGESSQPFLVPTARLFYTFIPADDQPRERPLFVFLNGGPGGATTAGLFLNGTGPYRLDPDEGGTLIENPASFTRLGNLLYIDTRMVGFSYDIPDSAHAPLCFSSSIYDMGCPSLDYRSHSIFVDAGDLVLTLLQVLAANWIPRETPVVLVGESYGGARVTMMLDFLLNPSQLNHPLAEFQDQTLRTALESHYRETLPKSDFLYISHRDASRQFGHQVLIQPGGMLKNHHAFFGLCDMLPDNDPRKPLCYQDTYESADIRGIDVLSIFDRAEVLLRNPIFFELLFGIRPEDVEGLSAAKRVGAFRGLQEPASSSLVDRLGRLQPYDTYYKSYCDIFSDFNMTKNSCDLRFRLNLGRVKTFITDAYYDDTVASFLIPNSLRFSAEGIPDPSIVRAWCEFDDDSHFHRPGQMTVVFNENFANLYDLVSSEVTVRMPRYYNAGHMVPYYQGLDFHDDVADFLSSQTLSL